MIGHETNIGIRNIIPSQPFSFLLSLSPSLPSVPLSIHSFFYLSISCVSVMNEIFFSLFMKVCQYGDRMGVLIFE